MQGITITLVVAAVVAAGAMNSCPTEQSSDWHIKKLLEHDDCNKFYMCQLGVPVEMECPHGLYFNLDLHHCDWMSNVKCEGRNDPNNLVTSTLPPSTTEQNITTEEPTTTKIPTTTVAPTTTLEHSTTTTEIPTTITQPQPEVNETTTAGPTTEPPVTEKEIEFQENGCPVDPHIHWLLPDAKNCTVFYYCVWGSKVQRECPSNLHFNSVLQVCDWPNHAGCTVSINKHRSFSNLFSRMF